MLAPKPVTAVFPEASEYAKGKVEYKGTWVNFLGIPMASNIIELDDGWPESEKGTDVDVKYIEERRRCEKISEERMNI